MWRRRKRRIKEFPRRIGQGAAYRLRNGFEEGAVAGARWSAGAGPEEGLKTLYTLRR